MWSIAMMVSGGKSDMVMNDQVLLNERDVTPYAKQCIFFAEMYGIFSFGILIIVR
jgi:hypothetical protein